MKSAQKIRKELAILIKEKHKTCSTEKERNRAVNDARAEMNKKYGHDWRDREISSNYNFNRPMDAQNLGDEWTTIAGLPMTFKILQRLNFGSRFF